MQLLWVNWSKNGEIHGHFLDLRSGAKTIKINTIFKKISDSYTSNSQTAGMIVLRIVLSINN